MLDEIDWRGADLVKGVKEYGNRMLAPGVSDETRERIAANLRNVLMHVKAFVGEEE